MKVLYTGPFSACPRKLWANWCIEREKRCEDTDKAMQVGDMVWWILPTRQLLQEVRQELLKGLPGLLGIRLLTFDEVAELVLQESHFCYREQTPLTRQLMMRQIGKEEKEALSAFSEIAHTPGFLKSMLSTIGELKRAGLAPQEVNRLAGLQKNERLKGLAHVYQLYQERLLNRKVPLLDPEDSLQMAAARLEAEPRRFFPELQVLFVDHFTDFTPLQKRLLAALLARDSLVEAAVYLPYLPEVWDERLPHLKGEVERFIRQTEGWGMAYRHFQTESALLEGFRADGWISEDDITAQKLQPLALEPHSLGADREPLKGQELVREVLPAAGVKEEVREVVREVKRLVLKEGVPLQEIALVVPHAEEYETHLFSTLREVGIPVNCAEYMLLQRVPLVGEILNLFSLPYLQWERERVLALAESRFFRWQHRPPFGFKGLLMGLGIVSGDEEWRERLQREEERFSRQIVQLCSSMQVSEEVLDQFLSGNVHHLVHDSGSYSGSEPEDDCTHFENLQHLASLYKRRQEVQAAREWFEEVQALLKRVPQAGKPEELVTAYRGLLHDVQVRERLLARFRLHPEEETHLRLNLQALAGVDKALTELFATYRNMELFEVKLDAKDFLRQWAMLLAEGGYDLLTARGEPGGLLWLEPEATRGLKKPVLFILGLNEGVFPAHVKEAWLLTDAERAVLFEGIHLPVSAYRQELEWLFFEMSQSVATRRITYSYVSPELREQFFKSGFLEELEGLVEPRRYEEARYTRSYPLLREQVMSLMEAQDRWCAVGVGARELAFKEENGALLFADFEGIMRRAAIEAHRRGQERDARWQVWDGQLVSAAAHEVLRRAFSGVFPLSVSLVNTYGVCPFKFYAERVLHLQETEEVEREIGLREQGNLIHEVLRRFFAAHRQEVLTESKMDLYEEELSICFKEMCEEQEKTAIYTSSPAWPLDKERMFRQLKRWLRQEVKGYNGEFLPSYFEFSFGLPLDERSDPASTPEPIEIQVGDERLPFYGRIDRVDLAEDGRFVIYDYKLTLRRYRGYPDVQAGVNFQLPVYLQAFQAFLQAVVLKGGEKHQDVVVRPAGAGFYQVTGQGTLKKGMWQSGEQAAVGVSGGKGVVEDLPTEVTDSLNALGHQLKALREGEFPVEPRLSCDPYCAYLPVCRFRTKRVRMDEEAGK